MSTQIREEFAESHLKSSKCMDLHSISHFIAQFVQFIRIIGCHPISIIKPKVLVSGASYSFKLGLCSYSGLFTIMTNVLALSFLADWMRQLFGGNALRRVLEEHYAYSKESSANLHFNDSNNNAYQNLGTFYYEKLDKFTLTSLNVIGIVVPVSGFYYVLSCMFSLSYLLRFLNGVKDFEIQIRKTFSARVVEISLIHLYHYRTKIVVFNCLIFLGISIVLIPSLVDNLSRFSILESKMFMAMFMLTSYGFVGVLDDTKVLLILKVVEEYFAQILDGISIYKMENPTKLDIDIRTIKNWKGLIYLARKQAKLAVKSIAQSGLIVLGALFVILTTSIYLVYGTIYKDVPDIVGTYSGGALIYCLTLFMRLHEKAVLAENITEKENELAKVLQLIEVNSPNGVNSNTIDAKNQLKAIELSFITDPLRARPFECNLGGAMPLKLSILYGLFHNVSTYAVAMIQMDSVQTNFQKILTLNSTLND